MIGFLAFYFRLVTAGFLFHLGGDACHVSYEVRKSIWEFIGSTYLLSKIFALYWYNIDLLDLVASFMTCPIAYDSVRNVIVTYTGWYVYSHQYQYMNWDEAYDNIMSIHHVITILLLTMAYHFEYFSEALATLFVLSLSTPLLHLSKILHMYGNRKKKWAFASFTIVFILARIIMFPKWLMSHTISAYDIVAYDHNLVILYYIVNALFTALYCMQLSWLKRILFICCDII